ncbi:hypothetical protein TNCV_1128951 [Trichonephila clavipes]|nr:hypothetical protein TNCV_1128951 [Trichonephila clavipes]
MSRTFVGYLPECHPLLARHPGFIVLSVTSFNSLSPLKVIRDILAQRQYVDKILSPIVLSFISQTPDLTFKQNNVRMHMYQMITFIDFCEEWFLPESVARVATIVRDHHCHTPRH